MLAEEFKSFREETPVQALTETVNVLASEFKYLRENPTAQVQQEQQNVSGTWGNTPCMGAKCSTNPNPWKDPHRTDRVKSSLLIKNNNGPQVDMKKIQEIATKNCIQVNKTTVKENGDIYVDMPSDENREKLLPLLGDVTGEAREVVKLKSKLPTISILNVSEFTTKEEFIEKVKQQNPGINERMEKGSEFSIVFSKKPNEKENLVGRQKYHLVVARVSDDIREVIKRSNNKIYMDLSAHQVVDRFYIKRCNKCQKFGHYQNECDNDERCGYCMGAHPSAECNGVQEGDHVNYKCGNCKDSGKNEKGHSTHWHKCPSYLDQQKKAKNGIPYYSQRSLMSKNFKIFCKFWKIIT